MFRGTLKSTLSATSNREELYDTVGGRTPEYSGGTAEYRSKLSGI
jgi:hypothetical protein